jgi:hypothetical protein
MYWPQTLKLMHMLSSAAQIQETAEFSPQSPKLFFSHKDITRTRNSHTLNIKVGNITAELKIRARAISR